MRNSLHIATTMLLSLVVLATSLLPPAYSHAHGSAGHDHSHVDPESANPHAHEGSHHHSEKGLSPHHAEHLASAGEHHSHGIEPVVTHVHFEVAGIAFSLPLAGYGGAGNPAPVDGTGPVPRLLTLAEDTLPAARVDVVSIIDIASVFAPVLKLETVQELQPSGRCNEHAACDRICLCDTARFARSGVLLI